MHCGQSLGKHFTHVTAQQILFRALSRSNTDTGWSLNLCSFSQKEKENNNNDQKTSTGWLFRRLGILLYMHTSRNKSRMTRTHRGLEQQIKFSSVFPISCWISAALKWRKCAQTHVTVCQGSTPRRGRKKTPKQLQTAPGRTHTLRDPRGGSLLRTKSSARFWFFTRHKLWGEKVALSARNAALPDAEAVTFLGIMTLQNEIIQQEM